jgi:tRNA(Ile)-lysidine synthase
LQEAARDARYRLLAKAAREVKARHILTAHTLDDQAETVLFRLLRGSGLAGLSGMARQAAVPSAGDPAVWLIRPLLDVPKSRLIATAKAAGADFADDPSNRDLRFTRPRLRALAPALAAEGLTANRLALLAKRVLRAEHALMQALVEAQARLAPEPWPEQGPVAMPATEFSRLPYEIALRLLGWIVGRIGNEGPVELGKLEALCAALAASSGSVRFRRTLAGAVVTRTHDRLLIERAPARRSRAASNRP